MSFSSISAIASQGMSAQATRLATSASNIANSDAPLYRRQTASLSSTSTGGVAARVSEAAEPSGGDADLVGDMVDMIESSHGFALNAAVLKDGADLWDMLATITG